MRIIEEEIYVYEIHNQAPAHSLSAFTLIEMRLRMKAAAFNEFIYVRLF